jgi:hypothetical protein
MDRPLRAPTDEEFRNHVRRMQEGHREFNEIYSRLWEQLMKNRGKADELGKKKQ